MPYKDIEKRRSHDRERSKLPHRKALSAKNNNLPSKVAARKRYRQTENGKEASKRARNKLRTNDPIKFALYFQIKNLQSKFWTMDRFISFNYAQQGLCAICFGFTEGRKNLDSDHDHRANTPRALLCNRCNRALGHLQDSQELALAVYDYLNKWAILPLSATNTTGTLVKYRFQSNGMTDVTGTKMNDKRKSLRRLGWSLERFQGFNIAQSGLCAICFQSNGGTLHADHNHETGEPRALICYNCNSAIGLLLDNSETALSVSKYLEFWEGK